jgi:hypothetical protein
MKKLAVESSVELMRFSLTGANSKLDRRAELSLRRNGSRGLARGNGH